MQHIVIADDSRTPRTQLRKSLTAVGFSASAAADGEPAHERIRAEEVIDVVRSLVPVST